MPAERRPIEGYPGYFVDTDGVVWSSKRGSLCALKPSRTRTGYLLVGLYHAGSVHTKQVHALVLETFAGPRPPGMEVRHFPDPDKSNNRLSNLRWGTHLENMRDMRRGQPIPESKTCSKCGEEKPRSEFYGSNTWDGLRAKCKKCHCRVTIATRDRERGLANWRAYYNRREAPRRAAFEVSVARFLAECCEFPCDATVGRPALLAAYKDWCARSGAEERHPRELSRRLQELGVSAAGKRNGVRLWRGVRLRPPAKAPGAPEADRRVA